MLVAIRRRVLRPRPPVAAASSLERYVKRMEELEAIAQSFEWLFKQAHFAISARA